MADWAQSTNWLTNYGFQLKSQTATESNDVYADDSLFLEHYFASGLQMKMKIAISE